MRSRLVAIALAGCSQGEIPAADPVAPPVVALADARVASADASGTADAGAARGLVTLRGTPLLGPYDSVAAACRAAPPCGGTRYDEASATITHPPKRPDCGQDPNNPRRLATPTAVIRPVVCATPPEIRGIESRYYLFLKHQDRWWRSDVLFSLDYNDKYCTAEVAATWESRGARVLARLRVAQACLDCAKNGDQEDTLDVLLVADRSRDVPVVFPPLVTGQHFERTPHEHVPPDIECRPERRDVTLTEFWRGDVLELQGPVTWKKSQLDPLVVWPIETVPSSVGTYELR